MDTRDDERLRKALGDLPVPEPSQGYRARRDRALAEAAGSGDVSTAVRPRSGRRRKVLLVAAAVALALVSVPAVVLLTHRGHSGNASSVLPVILPTPNGTSAGGSVLGKMPMQEGDQLDGLTRGQDGSLWAWGMHYSDRSQALLERWDGQHWSRVVAPCRTILGLAVVSANDAWIAGYEHGGDRIWHWDGDSWTVVWQTDKPFGFADTSETSTPLCAVSADDVWAFAADDREPQGARIRTKTMIWHWNGQSWRSFLFPCPPNRYNQYGTWNVKAGPSGDVWAINTSLNGSIIHWDGHRWELQPSPISQLRSGPKDAILINDLAVAPDGSVWCAGSRWFGPYNTDDSSWPVVLRLSQGKWQAIDRSSTTAVPMRGEATTDPLVENPYKASFPGGGSISLTSSSDVWLGGVHNLWHWDGTNWTKPAPDMRENEGRGNSAVVANAPGDVWVVGNRVTDVDPRLQQVTPYFLHFDGATWHEVEAAPEQP